MFTTILFLQGFVMMWKKQADILTVSDQIVDKVTGKTFIWTFFNFHEKDRAKTNYFDRSTFDHYFLIKEEQSSFTYLLFFIMNIVL